jgi:hypothetical protein
MKTLLAAFAFLASVSLLSSVSRPPDIPFEKHTLDLGANESCAIADLNNDGKLDIIAGENWFQAPAWTKHRFREFHFTNNYIDNFSDLTFDVDHDGFTDIVSCSWFSRQLVWWKNPGRTRMAWAPRPIETGMNVEFAFLVDMDGDGKAREVLPQFGGPKAITAWYAFENGAWKRHLVSDQGHGHGIGAGDVNRDGRVDVLTPKGWFEAPNWTFHPDWNFQKALGFLHVTDVNGDGRNDVVSSYAHDYGIFWLEHDAAGKFTERKIDDTWSQAHALTLVDLNGDGKLDVLSGKRYMAHEHEPGAFDPLGIYWYETIRTSPNPDQPPTLQWVRHVIDFSTRAGGGMQIPVADIDGDGDLDFAVAGKLGVFLFINKTK